MQKKTTLKNLYSEIRNHLCYMIPEKWNSIYLYASVIDHRNKTTNGEMFFYYFPKSIIKKNPINVYEVPKKFNIDEEEDMKLVDELYELIKKLREESRKLDGAVWSNITISMENVEFLVEYNYDELKNSFYTNDDRRIIWQYKHLEYPIEKLSKKERQMLESYLEEEEKGEHKVKTDSETFYQRHDYNKIKYNREEVEYVQENDEIEEQPIDDEEEIKPIKSQLLKITN